MRNVCYSLEEKRPTYQNIIYKTMIGEIEGIYNNDSTHTHTHTHTHPTLALTLIPALSFLFTYRTRLSQSHSVLDRLVCQAMTHLQSKMDRLSTPHNQS